MRDRSANLTVVTSPYLRFDLWTGRRQHRDPTWKHLCRYHGHLLELVRPLTSLICNSVVQSMYSAVSRICARDLNIVDMRISEVIVTSANVPSKTSRSYDWTNLGLSKVSIIIQTVCKVMRRRDRVRLPAQACCICTTVVRVHRGWAASHRIGGRDSSGRLSGGASHLPTTSEKRTREPREKARVSCSV